MMYQHLDSRLIPETKKSSSNVTTLGGKNLQLQNRTGMLMTLIWFKKNRHEDTMNPASIQNKTHLP